MNFLGNSVSLFPFLHLLIIFQPIAARHLLQPSPESALTNASNNLPDASPWILPSLHFTWALWNVTLFLFSHFTKSPGTDCSWEWPLIPPSIYLSIYLQSTLIIWDSVFVNSPLLKFTCNSQINTDGVFLVIGRQWQSTKNFEFPDVHIHSWSWARWHSAFLTQLPNCKWVYHHLFSAHWHPLVTSLFEKFPKHSAKEHSCS
jgi:hypothetical protein